MTIILRTQREQERVDGRQHIINWQADDFAVLDGETRIGRIYRTKLPAGDKWMWFLQILGAQPPLTGSTDTLDDAEAGIAARYETVRSQWRRC